MTGAGLATIAGAYENPGTMDASSLPTGVLWSDDVARLWNEHAKGGRTVTKETVWSYLDKSKPADPATGRAAGRYADDKMPPPAGRQGGRPFWLPGQIPDLVAWRLRHQDVGGHREGHREGRRRADRA